MRPAVMTKGNAADSLSMQGTQSAIIVLTADSNAVGNRADTLAKK
jgi:hypothetical protein